MARAGDGEDARFWQERANLLTPVAKAFSTDVGVDVASLGVQVHGGMGFIEETGAAALLRDARIAPIYEGTNGIQAIDLVTRKLPQSGGAHVRGYIAELRDDVEALRASNREGFGAHGRQARRRARRLSRSHDALLQACSAEGRTERRWPAPRPICGCSRWPRAAPIWRSGALARRRAAERDRALPLLRRKPRRRDRRAAGRASSTARDSLAARRADSLSRLSEENDA